ncbi:MAG: hypothetical protein QOD74_2465 [Variibacter sp.]|nr:hypothetical protein [Variibacter sp.]
MAQRPHLPQLAAIDSYGNGGFRFADMSHRGSLLCLPSGIWGWPVAAVGEIDEAALGQVFDEAEEIDLFLLGAGAAPWNMPAPLRARFRDAQIGVEISPTGAAVRTYNILQGERRRVAAGLIALP